MSLSQQPWKIRKSFFFEFLCFFRGVNEILSKHTGKTLKKVEQDTDRDNFLNAKEAKSYGIIDEILETRPNTNGK